jgi:hypothetical protein
MSLYHKYLRKMFYSFIEIEMSKGRKPSNIIKTLVHQRKRRRIRPSREFDKVLNEISRDWFGVKKAVRRTPKDDRIKTICLNRMYVPEEVVSLIKGLKSIGRFNDFAVEALRERVISESHFKRLNKIKKGVKYEKI